MSDTKSDDDILDAPATIGELQALGSSFRKELDDVRREWPKLNDGDPSNNAGAIGEIAQSIAVMARDLSAAVALLSAAFYALHSSGVL